MPALDTTDFATLFGTTVDGLGERCRAMIAAGDWRYRFLEGEELAAVIRDFEKRIAEKNFSIAATGDKLRWERGWSENLRDLVDTAGDVRALAPKYIRPDVPMRLNGRFIRSPNSTFELDWYRVFQRYIFEIHLGGFDHIFEFGCGSGINVALLAEMYPKTRVVGLDWAEASCAIVEKIRALRGMNVVGMRFDFFQPDASLEMPPNSAVLTLGALEQTGTKHGPFIDFLLAKRPRLCVFIEPVYERYDPANPVDLLAMRAHELRDFWRGFPSRLASLAKAGRAEIVKEKRSFFGSLVLEGYSQTIWRPLS